MLKEKRGEIGGADDDCWILRHGKIELVSSAER